MSKKNRQGELWGTAPEDWALHLETTFIPVYKKILNRQFSGASDVEGWIEDPLKAQRMVSGVCKELGLEFLDLYPILEAQSHRQLYIPRDGHFDRAAHEIVADALAKWIADSESQQNSNLRVDQQGIGK